MKTLYLPRDVYFALENQPNLSTTEIAKISGKADSTAARYKRTYRILKTNPDINEVRHLVNEVNIGEWRKNNHQPQQMIELLSELLNSNGFESTAHLREIYYKRYFKIKSGEPQSRRNFNRYFKMARDKLELDLKLNKYKLKICINPISRLGFYTIENLEALKDY
jgi:hypothetical protein